MRLRPAPKFSVDAFERIRRAERLPLRLRKAQKGEEVIPGFVQAFDHGGTPQPPLLGEPGASLIFGARTVLFTSSPSKMADAKRLGADEVVVSKNLDAMQKHADSFDLILDTVAAAHDLDAYTSLLKRDGTLVLVGVPEHPHPSPGIGNLLFKRRRIAGSIIGGIPETQEMLDFCAAHNIVSDIELIPIQMINEAYERMLRSDVKYRFVIDLASLQRH